MHKAIVLTVTQLNRKVRSYLEQDVGEICVEGEISNLSKPSSGHYYFTLKDETAQLKCVFFRNRHSQNNVNDLQNGQHIIITGFLSLYENRGDFQLIVDHITEAGEGNLFLQFEKLKKKLAALGLFDSKNKKSIPLYPNTIGVITSPTGAAIQDILTTLARRYPLAEIHIYPVEVQGKNSADQVRKAIVSANQKKECDVLIVARGGGSVEDLWSFNDENLAYAAFASLIPIVSGVGHETDFTIIDFTADLRAATPTAAAEAVSPNIVDLVVLVESLEATLINLITKFLLNKIFILQSILQKIHSPKLIINQYSQTLDYTKNNLYQALQKIMGQKNHLLNLANISLQVKNPITVLQQNQSRLTNLETKIKQEIVLKLNSLSNYIKNQMATLHAISPLATLDRGYALAISKNKIVRSINDVEVNENINIRLSKGLLKAKIVDKKND